MSKLYTITRRRTTSQAVTEQYSANSYEEAIAIAQKEQKQCEQDLCDCDWHDLDGDATYEIVTEDDIIEVEDE